LDNSSSHFIARLPNFLGHDYKLTCGQYLRGISCLDFNEWEDGHIRKVQLKRCFNPACQQCWRYWVHREAYTATKRLVAGAKLYGHKINYIRHISYSADIDTYFNPIEVNNDGSCKISVKKLSTYLKVGIKVIKKSGIQGGIRILHLFRKNKGGKGWRFGAHFHVLGWGYLKPVNEFHNETGWIYKNLGARKSVQATLSYQIDHASLFYPDFRNFYLKRRKKHIVSYFGNLGYSKVIVKDEYVKEELLICKRGSEVWVYEPEFRYSINYEGKIDLQGKHFAGVIADIDYSIPDAAVSSQLKYRYVENPFVNGNETGPFVNKIKVRIFSLKNNPKKEIINYLNQLI